MDVLSCQDQLNTAEGNWQWRSIISDNLFEAKSGFTT